MNPPRTVAWVGDSPSGFLRLIDQTLLPEMLEYRDCRTVEEVWEAIKVLRVRGAPAIGVAAAFGVVVGMQKRRDDSREAFVDRLREVTDYLCTSRPTAVNLFWAVDRVKRSVAGRLDELTVLALFDRLWREALTIELEDRRMCRAIGQVGADLIGAGQGVLTH